MSREYTGATRPLPLLMYATAAVVARSIPLVDLWSTVFSVAQFFSAVQTSMFSQQELSRRPAAKRGRLSSVNLLLVPWYFPLSGKFI
jgi:hypothetical protein